MGHHARHNHSDDSRDLKPHKGLTGLARLLGQIAAEQDFQAAIHQESEKPNVKTETK